MQENAKLYNLLAFSCILFLLRKHNLFAIKHSCQYPYENSRINQIGYKGNHYMYGIDRECLTAKRLCFLSKNKMQENARRL
jgi:hypothetical protein